MKKTLLLSLAASTAMMAGGDIAPVQPAVEAPVVEKKSIGNVTLDKTSGYAKLWYETKGAGTNDLFDNKNAFGDMVVSLKAEGTAGKLGYGLRVTSKNSTMIDSLVNTSRNGTDGKDSYTWAEEAYLTYAAGNNTFKLGRQDLNTPLAYTERWSSTANTFDAAVVINKSIEGVTLVGAVVDKGNTTYQNTSGVSSFDGTTTNSKFGQYVVDGAYAVAMHTKIGAANVNAYGYNVVDVADAYWVDADAKIGNVKVQGIYAGVNAKGAAKAVGDIDGYGVNASTKIGGISFYAAMSDVDKATGTNGDVGSTTNLGLGNTATNQKKTKLGTAGVYTDGLFVSQPGSEAYKIKAATKIGGVKVIAQYVDNENTTTPSRNAEETDIILVTKLGDFNVKGIYIDQKTGANLGTKLENVRIITTYKF